MRFVEYPTAGPPPALTNELEELVVLTHGAVEATNVERWALQFGAPPAPDLVGALRRSAYETDVVGTIHTLAQRYWERRGEAAVWERPFPTGQRGRPPAVDIALFNAATGTETRIEFGLCSVTAAGNLTRTKLAEDVEKLVDLAPSTLDNYPNVRNYVILWHQFRGPRLTMTKARRVAVRRMFVDFAASVTDRLEGAAVTMMMVSGGPLFSETANLRHWVAVGLFSVILD